MDDTRFLRCLETDFDRLRDVVSVDRAAAVPSCPGWTVADLAHHVGKVYLHKARAMRDGVEPEPWPPPELADEEAVALLDRAYAELRAEFAERRPEDAAGGWYTPDRTVGFWIRRMAQETVIHRIDAELAAGQPITPVPDDLAVDGIDELLKIFLAYSVQEWGSYFVDVLGDSPGRSFTLRTDGGAWRVTTGPGHCTVEGGLGDAGGAATDVTISGPPADLLRWVWNRDLGATTVTVEGPAEAVDELRRCITVATQ